MNYDQFLKRALSIGLLCMSTMATAFGQGAQADLDRAKDPLQHRLCVATPGIRDYLEFGGHGLLVLRDQPGWITFSIDGRYAYPSTGEVIETRLRKILSTLKDETGGDVQSEKMVEVDFQGTEPSRAGDQFGLGRVGSDPSASESVGR